MLKPELVEKVKAQADQIQKLKTEVHNARLEFRDTEVVAISAVWWALKQYQVESSYHSSSGDLAAAKRVLLYVSERLGLGTPSW